MSVNIFNTPHYRWNSKDLLAVIHVEATKTPICTLEFFSLILLQQKQMKKTGNPLIVLLVFLTMLGRSRTSVRTRACWRGKTFSQKCCDIPSTPLLFPLEFSRQLLLDLTVKEMTTELRKEGDYDLKVSSVSSSETSREAGIARWTLA